MDDFVCADPLARQVRGAVRWAGGVVLICCFLGQPVDAAPVISGLSPEAGPPGTSVAIIGSGLADVREVAFNNVPALFTIVTPNRIDATVPLEGVSGPVSVAGPSGIAVTFRHFFVSPRIADFIPRSAPPGVIVLISGENFQGTTAVRFNGTNALFSVTSPTQVQAVVPVGATSGPITLTTPVGTARSSTHFILTGPEPFIAGFAPASGTPGTIVVIEGVNFTGATAVRFNGQAAGSAAVTSPTQIRATVPAGASTGPITVTTPLGTGTSVAPFLVTSAPIIHEFDPIGGAAGTRVIINGLNFSGATAVRFGGTAATQVSIPAPTQIHATVPPGATNGPITITTPGGTGTSLSHFLATAAPIVFDFSPANGPPGSQIGVNGINFSTVTRATINGTNAPFSITAPSQVVITVPANASSGVIRLTNPAGSGISSEPFLVQTGRPIITHFEPPGGSIRTTVTIEGLDLSRATAVRFNGVNALFSAVSDTQIHALVPVQASSGPISVVAPAGTTVSSNRFIVAPRIASFSPASGAAGTRVTLRGTNLADLIAVRFREAVAQVESASTNQVIAIVPAEATTGSINLINPAGIIATPELFVVLPGITGFSPASGQAGTPVTITGSGFSEVIAVRFAGLNAVSFEVQSPTRVVAVVPARAASGPITVTTTAGTAASADSFIVGPTADLVLSLVQSTNVVLQNEILTYTTSVTNRGPSTATGVVLTNQLPSSFSFLSASTTQGTVSQRNAEVRVELGALAAGANARLTLTALSGSPGNATNFVSVGARELDTDPNNNSASATVMVMPSAAVLDVERAGLDRLRFSWPVAATNFVLQSTESLSPATPWQPVAATPTVAGPRRSVVLPVSGSTRFYRLIRP